MNEEQYQMFVATQHAEAKAFLVKQLNKLCEDLGWDKHKWRRLRAEANRRELKAVTDRLAEVSRGFQESMRPFMSEFKTKPSPRSTESS